MKTNKKLVVTGLLATVITICAAATSSKQQQPLYTNLKVLPKNISSKDLQSIMVDDFQDALGVTCGFCHANAKDGHGLDFASDEKARKGNFEGDDAHDLRDQQKIPEVKASADRKRSAYC